MRNEMNRENMMKSCRSALSHLAGVDDRTMMDVAEMNLRTAGASAEVQSEVMNSLFNERTSANEDFSF